LRKPELLIPAGTLDDLKIAVDNGTDAVYTGGPGFNLRGKTKNLTFEEIEEGTAYAHKQNVKVYITVNIAPRNEDLAALPGFLMQLGRTKVDALIIWDPGVISLAQELVPGLPLHLSAQANTLNWQSVVFWQDLGIKRVNLARELSLREIQEIRRRTSLELEIFIHGAMCIAYSGRCVLSNLLTSILTKDYVQPHADGSTI
jgi:putative protease